MSEATHRAPMPASRDGQGYERHEEVIHRVSYRLASGATRGQLLDAMHHMVREFMRMTSGSEEDADEVINVKAVGNEVWLTMETVDYTPRSDQ